MDIHLLSLLLISLPFLLLLGAIFVIKITIYYMNPISEVTCAIF